MDPQSIFRPLGLALLLVLSACNPGQERQPGALAEATSPALPASAPASCPPPPDFAQLVERYGAAVVNISTTQTVQGFESIPGFPDIPEDNPFFEFFRRFMPPGQHQFQTRSLGSGFIIGDDGYILTNAHVVANASEVTVKLTDKRELKAKVVGADRRTDVAVIKIDGNQLPKVVLGDSRKLKVGEWVAAIGSPFGFENSVTKGIVSAIGRRLPDEDYVPFIQTDVPVNPGNSGGPLFNLNGEVIGVNSQIYSRSGGFQGLAFAIPIDIAMNVADQLKHGGKVSRGRIGVQIQEVTQDLASSFGMARPAGALVASVEKGGPAERAGIVTGDVVVKYDGKPVESSADLPLMVASTKPGQKVQVEVWRNRKTETFSVTVGAFPDEKGARTGAGQSEEVGALGLTLRDLSADNKEELQVPGGAMVESASGPAAKAGLRRGDVILSVDQQAVLNARQAQHAISKKPAGSSVALLIRRGEQSSYVVVKP
jgi:serine protease Do